MLHSEPSESCPYSPKTSVAILHTCQQLKGIINSIIAIIRIFVQWQFVSVSFLLMHIALPQQQVSPIPLAIYIELVAITLSFPGIHRETPCNCQGHNIYSYNHVAAHCMGRSWLFNILYIIMCIMMDSFWSLYNHVKPTRHHCTCTS